MPVLFAMPACPAILLSACNNPRVGGRISICYVWGGNQNLSIIATLIKVEQWKDTFSASLAVSNMFK
jgi:hypothetical protein